VVIILITPPREYEFTEELAMNAQTHESSTAASHPGIAVATDAVAAIAAANAAAVDRDSRFPKEAIAAAKEQRLLGIQVPYALGGQGAGLHQIVDVCYRLGRACSSTAMVFAMHQIKVACLLRHYRDNRWIGDMLRRLAAEQLLLASSTTEGAGGGNVRSSDAALEYSGSRISLHRRASVVSYGAEADGIVTTARRSADAAASDQVLVVFLKEHYTLEALGTWDALGMRGTCSRGYALHAAGEAEQVVPDPYEKIHALTMTPFAHLTWAGVWSGIAAAAVERARDFVRNAARQSGGQLPPGSPHYTRAYAALLTLHGMVASAVRNFEAIQNDERALRSMEFQTAIHVTKVEASELAVSIVLGALRACGLSGYRNDGDFSVVRHLRDVLSAPIMINNDRILSNLAATSSMSGIPNSIVQ